MLSKIYLKTECIFSVLSFLLGFLHSKHNIQNFVLYLKSDKLYLEE